MLPLALGFSASLCWGLADFSGGLETRRLPAPIVVLVSQFIGLAVLGAVLAFGTNVIPTGGSLVAACLAGVAGAVGITAFYRALSIGTMSVVAPIAATGAIVPVAFGLFGGDRPSPIQEVGMLAAAVGVILAAQDGQANRKERRQSQRSIVLALVAAISLGSGLAALDRATGAGTLQAVFCARVVSVSLLLLVCLIVRSSVGGLKANLPGLAAIGLLDTSATVLYTVATTYGLLSLVAVSSSLYPVVTVVLARALLAERIRPIQSVGVTTAVGGVLLLTAG